MATSGCGSSEAAEKTPIAEIDPRFASAQGLLEYFNSLNTQMPPDYRNLLPLYHLESEFQSKQHAVLAREASSAYHDLDRAFYQRYGVSFLDWPQVRRRRPPLKPCTAAILTKIEPRRAEGSFTNQWGKMKPLHLVEYGGRWWVSGYTLEYQIDPDFREHADGFLGAMLEGEARSHDFLRPLIDGIRNGQYPTAESARQAYLDASQRDFEARRQR